MQDLEAPGSGDPAMGAGVAPRDWGADVLAQLREVPVEGEPVRALQPFPPAVEQALYAWAVSCYECGLHEDAAVLLQALEARQHSSPLLLMAQAANAMGQGNYQQSAQYYQRIPSGEPEEAEALFYRAQLEHLQGRSAFALALLNLSLQRQAMARSGREDLHRWCQNLLCEIKSNDYPTINDA